MNINSVNYICEHGLIYQLESFTFNNSMKLNNGIFNEMRNKFYFLLICFLFINSPVKADFISWIRADQCETIIEIFIEENQIRVTYEIGLSDWKYFKELIPEDLLKRELITLIRSKGANYFFENVFTINADGKNLMGKIVRQEILPRKYRASLYTGVVEENLNISKEILYTEIIYSFHNKPKKVIITPPIIDGTKTTKANIGFVTYHKNIPVNDLRYLSQGATLNLNWNDPWYSKFNNKNLRRHHQSSLMSFLYIDPYEVRHEVLVRLKDLEEWIDFGYELDDYIEVNELDIIKEKVANFLITRNIVTIDDQVEKPIVDKIHFVKWSLAGIQIQEIKERMPYSSTVIGVIFAYPHKSIAKKITIDWDLFSETLIEIPNVATDPAGPMPYILKKDDHILVWNNYLKKYKLPAITEIEVSAAKLPLLHLLSFLLILFGIIKLIRNRNKILKYGLFIVFGILLFLLGSSLFKQSISIPFLKQTSFSKPEASSLISHLLKNTYRAFDFREESDIYDKLAISNDQDLLAELYLQTKKSMVLESQGGIQVKVKDVEILEVEEVSSNSEGISFKCIWVVKGDVGHWGHIHSRINQYKAILNVKPDDGVWKLNAIDIIEEQRL